MATHFATKIPGLILRLMGDAALTRSALHQLLDEIPESYLPEVSAALNCVQKDALRGFLRTVPALEVPGSWPNRPAFSEPIPYEGELPSDELVRERR